MIGENQKPKNYILICKCDEEDEENDEAQQAPDEQGLAIPDRLELPIFMPLNNRGTSRVHLEILLLDLAQNNYYQ